MVNQYEEEAEDEIDEKMPEWFKIFKKCIKKSGIDVEGCKNESKKI